MIYHEPLPPDFPLYLIGQKYVIWPLLGNQIYNGKELPYHNSYGFNNELPDDVSQTTDTSLCLSSDLPTLLSISTWVSHGQVLSILTLYD